MDLASWFEQRRGDTRQKNWPRTGFKLLIMGRADGRERGQQGRFGRASWCFRYEHIPALVKRVHTHFFANNKPFAELWSSQSRVLRLLATTRREDTRAYRPSQLEQDSPPTTRTGTASSSFFAR